MPQVDVPGIGRVEFPDNMTHADMAAAIDRTMKYKAGEMALEGTGAIGRGVIGAGKAVSDLWLGGKQLLGFANDSEVSESRARDAALMNTTSGKVGNFAGNVAAAIPTMFIPGVNTAVGAGIVGGGMGALQPTVSGESRLMNTAIGIGGGVAGQKLGNVVGNWAGARLANRRNVLDAEQIKNQPRDAIINAARQEGYVFPPTSINPSATNSVLEAVSGKIKTAQAASFKNQDVTDTLAKRAVGMGSDDALDASALQAIRDQAGDAYKVVAGMKSVNWDHAFENGVNALKTHQSSGAVKNPANKEITDLVDGLLQKASWTGAELVDDIKLLREMGHANRGAAARAGGDTAKDSLGKAQIKASKLLEDLADRNLSNNKAPATAIQDLRDARQLIAKTYSVERALGPSGRVNAHDLAAQLKKGKPLSGELETIAKTASAFRDATRSADNMGSVNPLSAVDAVSGSMLGGLTAAATGNPMGLLAGGAPLLRPLVRGAMLTSPYQKAMVNPQSYSPGLAYTLPDSLAWNPLVRRSMAPAGAAGLLGYAPQQ
jgi:hypothetical protein